MDYRFVSRIKVYFRDVDMLGHVNNVAYAGYLEIARVDLLESLFGRDGFERMPYVLGELHVRYLRPARLRDVLEVGIRIGEIGRKSFTYDYILRDAATGEVKAEARTVQVMCDFRTGKTYEVPQEVRDAVAAAAT